MCAVVEVQTGYSLIHLHIMFNVLVGMFHHSLFLWHFYSQEILMLDYKTLARGLGIAVLQCGERFVSVY